MTRSPSSVILWSSSHGWCFRRWPGGQHGHPDWSVAPLATNCVALSDLATFIELKYPQLDHTRASPASVRRVEVAPAQRRVADMMITSCGVTIVMLIKVFNPNKKLLYIYTAACEGIYCLLTNNIVVNAHVCLLYY